MSAEHKLYNRILAYFESEFLNARKRLEAGQFSSFKERVMVGQNLSAALTLLSPYARGDQRARRLVKSGEALRNELLSVRDVIEQKGDSPKERLELLIAQIMKKREYLQ